VPEWHFSQKVIRMLLSFAFSAVGAANDIRKRLRGTT